MEKGRLNMSDEVKYKMPEGARESVYLPVKALLKKKDITLDELKAVEIIEVYYTWKDEEDPYHSLVGMYTKKWDPTTDTSIPYPDPYAGPPGIKILKECPKSGPLLYRIYFLNEEVKNIEVSMHPAYYNPYVKSYIQDALEDYRDELLKVPRETSERE